MPSLTINNDVTVTNVNGVSLAAIPVVNPRINVITVAGLKGDKGDPGTNGGGGSAGVTGLNGLTGAINIIGNGSTLISLSGNNIVVSGGGSSAVDHGDGINLSGNLQLTGQQAWNAANNNGVNLSGNLNASGRRAWDDATNLSGNLFSTGNLAILRANSIGVNLSGNLTLTGQALLTAIAGTGQNAVNYTDVRVAATGLANANYTDARVAATGLASVNYTDARVAATGLANVNYTDTRVAATGQSAWIASQNNALNLSGNLTLTGQTAQNNTLNLSGSLFTTGSTLIARDLATSGELSSRLVATGANLSAVSITGGFMQTPNFTGMGGTLIIRSGNFVLISGATSSASNNGDGINLSGNLTLTGQTAQNNALNLSGNLFTTGANLSAVKVTGSSIVQVANLTGYGSTLVFLSGGYVVISGAPTTQSSVDHGDGINLSGNLTLTGQTAQNNALNLSGNLTLTGQTAQNNALNLSGRLTATGALLSAVQVTGSSLIQNVNLTGFGGTIVTYSGGYVIISGIVQPAVDHGDGINISGNLTLTGQTAQNNALNLSGSLFTTGSTLIARDLATSGELSTRLINTGANAWNNVVNLSGNLFTTGANLSAVSITGGFMQTPNFTGLGGTLIVRSGNFVLISGVTPNNSDGLNLSGNLTLTGQTAQNNALNLSGSLFTTGSTLIARDLATSGELDRRLVATGSNAWNNVLNLSGNLFTTGANLSAVKVTGSSIIQVVNLTGMGGNIVTYSGGYVIVSGIAQPAINYGDGINLSGQLTLTGQTAQNNALNLSGNLNASGRRAWDDATNLSGNLFSTGNLAILNANGVGANLSGRLTATGALLSAVTVTGSSLIQNANFTGMGGSIVFISGGYVIVSGAISSLAGVDHGDGINLSGNLTLTGQILQSNDFNLSGNINASGRRAWDDATNLSGRLTATGALLSAVQVTGSSLVQNVNLSGLGGTIVLLSGGYVLISGAGGGSSVANNGDGINLSGQLTLTGQTAQNNALNLSGSLFTTGANLSAVKVTGSNIIQVANFTGMGGALVTYSGGYVIVSGIVQPAINYGDGINLSGQLTLTGQTAQNNALNLSGNLNASGRRAWDDATNLSGNLFSTGNLAILNANGVGLNLSGRLVATGALLSAVQVTGSSIIQNVNLTGMVGVLVTYSGGYTIVSGAINVSDGINLSGNLFTTGSTLIARDLATSGELDRRLIATGANAWNNVLNLSGNLNASGRRAWDDATNLSGNLFSTGNLSILYANGIGLNLSGRLVATGTLLSAVQVTGSALVQNVNLTGLGGTLVLLSGGYVLISGAAGSGPGGGVTSVDGQAGAVIVTGTGNISTFVVGGQIYVSGGAGTGAGVNTLNGLQNAVNIQGTGNFSVVTVGQNLVISGSALTNDRQVLFDKGGFTSGENRLQWNYLTGTLSIGVSGVSLPDNPLSVAGSGDTYIQINIQNRSSGKFAQADYIATADVGTDTNYFIDLGINNSGFSHPDYELYKPLDGFLYNRGGDMFLGTATPEDNVYIHVGGIKSGNLISTFDKSGLLMQTGMNVRFANTATNTVAIQPIPYARKQNLAVIQSGLDSMALQPALWNRTFTMAMPATTTSQTLFGNTAVNVGTLSTVRDQILGKHTNVVSAAGQGAAAGLGFTTPDFLRGTITGAGNGFFFTCRFALADGINPTGAYLQPSGSRIFIGLTDQTSTTSTQLNNPAGNRAGLSVLYASGGAAANVFDTNWAWSVRDNTTELRQSMGWAFQTGQYRFSMYCPPFQAGLATSGIWYQLDDLLRGSGMTGVMTGYLPVGTTALGPVASITTISGGARNIKINSIYCEEARGGVTSNFY